MEIFPQLINFQLLSYLTDCLIEGIGKYDSAMSDLIAGQTYYLRAYATNNEGTAYARIPLLLLRLEFLHYRL